MFEIDTFITFKTTFFDFDIDILFDNSTKQSWDKIDVFKFCKNWYMIWIVNFAKRFTFIIFSITFLLLLLLLNFFCSNSNSKISKSFLCLRFFLLFYFSLFVWFSKRLTCVIKSILLTNLKKYLRFFLYCFFKFFSNFSNFCSTINLKVLNKMKM